MDSSNLVNERVNHDEVTSVDLASTPQGFQISASTDRLQVRFFVQEDWAGSRRDGFVGEAISGDSKSLPVTMSSVSYSSFDHSFPLNRHTVSGNDRALVSNGRFISAMAKVLGRASQARDWLQTNPNWPAKCPLVSSELYEQGVELLCPAASALPLPWLALAQARQPEGVRGDTNFVAEAGEHFASHFELPCFALCPLLSGFSQTMVNIRDVSGGGVREAGGWRVLPRVDAALRLK